MKISKKFFLVKTKEIKNNPNEAKSVLVNAGIFTQNGTLKKVYKDICTQQGLI